MIMKKFEALERVQAAGAADSKAEAAPDGEAEAAASAPADERGLTEAQLLEVFKQTSQFTVRTALAGNEVFGEEYFGGEGGGDDAYIDDEDWEEDDGGSLADFFGDGEDGEARRRRGPSIRGIRAPREAKPPAAHKLTAYNRDNKMLLRRKKIIDPYELLLVKMPPPPLPSSWGKMVSPYSAGETSDVKDFTQISANNMLMLDGKQLRTDYLGVLLNPPWKSLGFEGGIKAADLSALKLPQLCPLGFIFVWVEKETLDEVVDVLGRHGYVYVENLTWVILQPNNKVARLPAAFLGRSHRTLLIFRRDVKEHPKGREVELRHQRSPDVDLCIGRSGADGRLLTPEAAYLAIETLLPGGYATPGQPGRFLELWGHNESKRPGWTSVVCA